MLVILNIVLQELIFRISNLLKTGVTDPSDVELKASLLALTGIVGILLLGMGGIMIILLSGHWVRRWIYQPPQNQASSDCPLNSLDWTRSNPPTDIEQPKQNKI